MYPAISKTILPFLLLFFASVSLNGQNTQRCGTDQAFAAQAQENPALMAAFEAAETRYRNYLQQQASQRNAQGARYIIPVVVHVIHNPADDTIGNGSNVSDERIAQQIRIMNEDFRRMPNTNGEGAGADSGIEFRLTEKDPNGQCTNGIIRLPFAGSNTHNYLLNADQVALKGNSYWPRKRYLNLWVIDSITNGDVGYANFPWNTGTPAQDSLDGIVVVARAFGLSGGNPFHLGHTGTHEAGHWLGLLHTFQNGCPNADCSVDGDRVCDTPPIANSTSVNWICANTANTCSTDTLSGFATDQNDMTENFMDYTGDVCMNRYTPGQVIRMRAYLDNERAAIWTDTNRVFTGIKGLLHDFDSVGIAAALNGKVTAMVEWEAQNKLILVGSFSQAAGLNVPGICSWDGTKFDSLPGAPTFDNLSNQATCMTVYKNELYVGGTFTFWTKYKHLVKYDGATWSKVTTNGDISATSHSVRAMQVYKGKLYVGGDFGQVDGFTVNANRVAVWDGSAWNYLGTSPGSNGLYGSSPACYAMTIHEDKLVLGGRFDTGDTVACDKVILWDGNGFSSIDTDSNKIYSGSVNSLGSYAGKLFAGGDYYSVGGKLAQFFSYYDGTAWKNANTASGTNCLEIEPFNGYIWVGGSISALNPGGEDTYNLFVYDVEQDTFYNVTPTSNGMDAPVLAMELYKNELYIAGRFVQLQGAAGGANISFDHVLKVHTYCENPAVGMEERPVSSQAKVIVYPNPAQQYISFQLPEEWKAFASQKIHLEVYDNIGHNVLLVDLPVTEITKVKISHLQNGTYLYQLHDKWGRQSSGRFVVLR